MLHVDARHETVIAFAKEDRLRFCLCLYVCLSVSVRFN